MAVRTNATAVEKVLLKDYDADLRPDLAPFIEAAAAIVDDVVECALDKDITIGATRQELIERWLAAHFYAVTDRPYQSKSTEGASATFQGQTAMYFEGSHYGQMAISLDPSGCLTDIQTDATSPTGRSVASGFWLGKAPSEQTDYIERD